MSEDVGREEVDTVHIDKMAVGWMKEFGEGEVEKLMRVETSQREGRGGHTDDLERGRSKDFEQLDGCDFVELRHQACRRCVKNGTRRGGGGAGDGCFSFRRRGEGRGSRIDSAAQRRIARASPCRCIGGQCYLR